MPSSRCMVRLAIGILFLGTTLGLVACKPVALGRQPTITAPAQPAAGSIEVTDAAGRVVAMEKQAQRIVVVGPSSFMVLHALYLFPEARQRLVAFDRKVMTSMEFLGLVDPDLGNKTVLQVGPGIEEIAALHPDLVLMKNTGADTMSQGLGQLGIPVVYLGLETPEQFEKDIVVLGILLQDPARAQQIQAFYRSGLDRIQQGLADIGEAQRPRVLLCQYSMRGNQVAVSVPAQAWMQTIQVEKAGGTPVWLESAEPTNGWKVVNLEQIVRWNPDRIVIVAYNEADPSQLVATLQADPIWSGLKAVSAGQIYVFPSDFMGWDMPDPRWILGLEWLATRFHPDRFSEIDMQEQVHLFFGQLYGIEGSVIDAKIMPGIKLDIRTSP